MRKKAPRLTLINATIKNYRSIESFSFRSVGRFNIIIGKNSSGKSNIMKALHFALSFLKTETVYAVRVEPANLEQHFGFAQSEEIAISLSFILSDGDSHELSVTAVVLSIPSQDGENRLWWLGELLVEGEGEDEFIIECNAEQAFMLLNLQRDSERLNKREALLAELKPLVASASSNAGPYINRVRAAIGNEVEAGEAITGVLQNPHINVIMAGQSAFAADIEREKESVRTRFQSLTAEIGDSPTLDPYRTLISKVVLYHSGDGRPPLTESDRQHLFKIFVERSSAATRRSFEQLAKEVLDCNVRIQQDSSGKPAVELNDFLESANGSGVRGAFRLLSDLHLTDPDVAFIEEPELHLHPALSRAVASHLRGLASQAQIFVATHSADFVDMNASSEELNLVGLRRRRTELIDVSPSDESGEIAESLGLRPSSILMFDRLVLVEGPFDEAVLRVLASKCGIRLAPRGVGFLHLGGGSTQKHVAAERLLKFLAGKKIKVWCLLDSDELSGEDMTRTLAKFRESDTARAVFWRKREIENYLISIPAMTRQINARRSMARLAQDISESEVRDRLPAIEPALRSELVRLRIRAGFLPRVELPKGFEVNSAKAFLEERASEISDAIRNFDSLVAEIKREVAKLKGPDLMNRVPGSFLLDEVFKGFGVRFDKSQSETVANLIERNFIDAEVVTILQQIGSANDGPI